ncbi:WXG100 family type VII secretion target [Mycobacterium sp. NPDC050853]|uniref:WXG100 family type VII secretion target n=1 Tax=Mycobacterium sp. NPDC050853 TaxID=3155160 RepID=UPI0033F79F38
MTGTEGPPGESLQITPERVLKLAEDIASSTSDFATALTQLDDQVRRLLGAGWKGDPGSQFHDAFADWHQGTSDVTEGMNSMVSALQGAATAFRVADDRVSGV